MISMVNQNKVGGVDGAKGLEFIVIMKGDYYYDILPNEVDFDSDRISSIKKR